MKASDLYLAMKARFTHAPAIAVATAVQTKDNGEPLESYSITIYSSPIGSEEGQSIRSHYGYGFSVQECLNDLKEVEE
jgi:hypothetical protein